MDGETDDENHSQKSSTALLTAADNCLKSGNYGKAFNHLLTILKLSPDMRERVKSTYVLTYQELSKELEEEGKIEELFHCYKQAGERYPDCEPVLNSMGSQLFRLGFVDEAASCFRRALKIDPDYLAARENLENVCSQLVERWHFRMLNDVKRNHLFSQALKYAYDSGGRTYLDIGSGSGILSMLAVRLDTEAVYACEMSRTMYELSGDVIAANCMSDRITLIHKESKDLEIPNDIPERVDVVVTETFDAGLLGEGILPTLQHAWKYLIRSPAEGGQVIPYGATVHIMVIESEDIRLHSRLVYPAMRYLDMTKAVEACRVSSCDEGFEPYTSERINFLRSGYQTLAKKENIQTFDFNNPELIDDYISGKSNLVRLPVIKSGRCDAIIMWFTLRMTPDIKLDTGFPNKSCHHGKMTSCWEQAVYPVDCSHLHNRGQRNKIQVKQGDELIIEAVVNSDHMMFKIKDIVSSTNVSSELSISTDQSCPPASGHELPTPTTEEGIDQLSKLLQQQPMLEDVSPRIILQPHEMSCLNDIYYNTACCVALSEIFASCSQRTSVITMTQGLSFLCLQLLKLNIDRVLVTDYRDDHQSLILSVAKHNDIDSNKIVFGDRNFECIGEDWDLLFTDIVEPCGALRQQVLEDITLARITSLRNGGRVLPYRVTVQAMLISSTILRDDSRVVSNSKTLGLDIAKYMNIFQMSTHIDIDLHTLPHVPMSHPFTLFDLHLNDPITVTTPSFLEQSKDISITSINKGHVTAVVYWFDLHLTDRVKVSTLDKRSHWNVAAVIQKLPLKISNGLPLKVKARLRNSCIDIKVERTSEKK